MIGESQQVFLGTPPRQPFIISNTNIDHGFGKRRTPKTYPAYFLLQQYV